MKPARKSRDEIIKELGSRWPIAVRAAFLVVRADSRLVGMDTLRDPLIERAAFLSFDVDPPAFPVLASVAVRSSETAKILDELEAAAVSTAKTALHEAKLCRAK